MGSAISIWLSTMPVISLVVLASLLTQTGNTARGIELFRQGRFTEARAGLETSLLAHPEDATARAFLAMTKAAAHDCQAAQEEFSQNTDSALSRLAGLAAVECLSTGKESAQTFALIAKLETKFPGDPEVLYESAKLHRKAWDSAVHQLYLKAPSSFRVNQLSAEIFETQGNYGEAAAQYAKAIAKAPNALNLHFRRGRCLLLDSPSPENLVRARAEFDNELKLNPSDAVAEYEIGQILNSLQHGADANTHYERALQLSPSFAEASIAVGKIRAQQKQYTQAVELFRKAIAIQPDNEAAHYNLMLAYRNLGRPEEAMQQKRELDRLQKPPEGEFTEFLKKLGEKAPRQ